MAFTDLTILCQHGTSSPISLLSLCVQKFRERSHRLEFEFQSVTQQPIMIFAKIHVQSHYANTTCVYEYGQIISREPLHSHDIGCFEMYLYYADSIGVSDSNGENTCIFSKKADTLTGVFGVVINKLTDQILFYSNGKFLKVGNRRPSKLPQLHAYVKLAKRNSSAQIIEKYLYSGIKV